MAHQRDDGLGGSDQGFGIDLRNGVRGLSFNFVDEGTEIGDRGRIVDRVAILKFGQRIF